MKIGQFGESFIPIYDGVGRVMEAYANAQSKRGHEVYVITPQYETGWRGNFPYEIIDYYSLRFTKKWPYKIGWGSFDPHFVARMKNVQLDIVHAHGPMLAGELGMHYAHKNHIPIIGTFHTKFYDDILAFTKSKAIATLGARKVAAFYDNCDARWAVSENAAETLREYGAKKEILIMPNGTTQRELHTELIPGIISEYKLRTDVPMILFVGRITFEKNLKAVLESCSLLKKKGMDFSLVFVGMGPDYNNVIKMAKNLDISDKLNMVGFIQDTKVLDCFYHLASVFLFPSIFDNSPLVVREAAAMKTISLVINGSSSAESITDMVNGLKSENTPESICEKLNTYFTLPENEKLTMKENAYKDIPVSWDGPLMDNILDKYQELITTFKKRT